MRFAYKFSADDISQAFVNLLGLANIYLADQNAVIQAIKWHKTGMDFADALHLAQVPHCDKLYTFDKRFISKAKGVVEGTVVGP